MKKILVTGGAGYIGSHTCIALCEQGYEVVAADTFCNSHREAVKRTRELAGQDFPLYELDIREEAALNGLFEKEDIGCVIHFAGLKAVGESVREPLLYYENNLMSTLTLLKVMEKHGVQHLIFSSSATVYREENPVLPESLPSLCLTGKTGFWAAPIPTVGQNTWESGSFVILPPPGRAGLWLCCGTSIRWELIPPGASGRIRRGSPTI